MLVYRVERKITKILNRTKGLLLNNGVPAYWWDGQKNFGDLITPELLVSLGYTPIHTSPAKAELIAVGSLLQILPSNYAGKIIGTGLIKNKFVELPHANFISVRGELTKRALSLPNSLPTGDLGLLSDRLVLLPEKIHCLGVVPHYADNRHPWLMSIKELYQDECIIIDVRNKAANVIKQISSCNYIISSSLHGIIVADSLGIPNIWVELSTNVEGGGFKFEDYNTSIDYEQPSYTPDKLSTIGDIEKCLSEKSVSRIEIKKAQIEVLFKEALSARQS